MTFPLGWVRYCTCGPVCLCIFALWGCPADNYLFENHELVQEVNTLAGEEFPDGLQSLETLGVSGGTDLGGLVSQEVRQRKILQKQKTKKNIHIHIYFHLRPCVSTRCMLCNCNIGTTMQTHLAHVTVCFHACTVKPDELRSRNSGSCTICVI